MVIGKMEKTVRQDWLFANPWPWVMLGLALCLANWLAVFIVGESLNGLGMSILFVGLLLTAAGVVIRLNSSAPSFMDRLTPPPRSGMLLAAAHWMPMHLLPSRRLSSWLSAFSRLTRSNCGLTRSLSFGSSSSQ